MSPADPKARQDRATKVVWVSLLVASVALAGGLSWVGSEHPDGLERVAEDLGFAGDAQEGGAILGGPWAGLAATLIVLALTWGLFRLLRHSPRGQGKADDDQLGAG